MGEATVLGGALTLARGCGGMGFWATGPQAASNTAAATMAAMARARMMVYFLLSLLARR